MTERDRISKELSELLFQQREEDFVHNSLGTEMRPYELIKQGDLKGVSLAQAIYTGNHTGTLSADPVRNKQYLFVATITYLCRVCIEGGMNSAISFGLSDLFIRRADQCATVPQLEALHEEMLREYALRMRGIQRENVCSIHVVRCMDYVEQHLQQTIRIPDIADALGISVSYLSSSFSQEVGLGLGEYIRRKKLEAARLLLQHSDFTCTEIAEYFAFSSSAYFSKAFREFTGYTPANYRKLFFQKALVPAGTENGRQS